MRYDDAFVSIKKRDFLDTCVSLYERTRLYCPVSSHEETFRASPFSNDEVVMKNVIAQSVTSLLQRGIVGSGTKKSYDSILKFARESSQLQSKLTLVCVQVINIKKIISKTCTLDSSDMELCIPFGESSLMFKIKVLGFRIKKALEKLTGAEQRDTQEIS